MIEFLQIIVPTWHSNVRPLVETAIFSAVGGAVAFVIAEPVTPPQALSAGLGWMGLIGAFSPKRTIGRGNRP